MCKVGQSVQFRGVLEGLYVEIFFKDRGFCDWVCILQLGNRDLGVRSGIQDDGQELRGLRVLCNAGPQVYEGVDRSRETRAEEPSLSAKHQRTVGERFEVELRNQGEIVASTSQRPVQVWIRLLTDFYDAPRGSNDFIRCDVIASPAIFV